MFKTRITEMLGIKYPILCGGMQWLSHAAFVAEIGNAGGGICNGKGFLGAIHEIKTARQVIKGIVTEAEELLSCLNQMKMEL